MSDSEEKKTKDSRTINIEIPAGGFEGMFRMMAGSGGPNIAGSGCCDTSQGRCRPQSEDDEGQEFKIVIKEREQG